MLRLKLFFILAVSGCLISLAERPEMDPARFNVASYNLRQANHSDSVAGNGWGRRLPWIADLVRFHDFEIFGTQEGFRHQLDSLVKHMPGYAYTGVGREDGVAEGEHSAIFYRTDLFELLDSGDFWLSETPDVPGRLGWDAVCPRICSWGKFYHYPSGQVFVFMNLHMDHVGKQARIESARLVKKRIAEVAGGAPAFVTGDFNVDQTHQSYRTMLGNGDMNDSFEVAEVRYAPNGTFNGYHTDGFSTSRIDHVFITPGVRVERYGVLTDTYRTDDASGEAADLRDAPGEIESRTFTPRVPSDHYPVMIVASLPKPEDPGSLRRIYDRISALDKMTVFKKGDGIFENIGLKNIKGEAAVGPNAGQRAKLLEAVAAIPSDLVVFNREDDGHNISRCYFRPVSPDSDEGEALVVVVGHGTADTVIGFVPRIKRAKLMSSLK
ncbi:MAG: endonuclease/exonuclease/phosphatase family protein [Paramuribaculum sp.]|nr:endonuclease/exonuclease/phosphatase family protein [Paramuribaculum sp.]MDE6323894.1 endonuclease/exonuclease/phosphatase family protein [Paramuribaculum sp.]MDE6489382.1 endonuclease/exonuclease/phosphatase family protein [Paramuribaculum sp.]